MNSASYDVLVVGGGPAGLSAALYLARYNRRVGLFDSGRGRSTWHQINHNYLGFPGGVPARQLRELGRQQLAEYEQVTILEHTITQMRQDGKIFTAEAQAGRWHSRAVIIATGVIDHYPHFHGWEEYVGRSMFWCITCDGYSCMGECVVVAGKSNDAAAVALQMQRFTENITLLTDSAEHSISDTFIRRLDRAHIPLIVDRIAAADGRDGQLKSLYTKSGQRVDLDKLFSVQGSTPQTSLATMLGVTCNQHGYIMADAEQKTNVPGVFAAGDVTRLHSHQVATAVHEGGQAASAANYFLYPPDMKDE